MKAPNEMLLGEPGSGKTHAFGSFLEVDVTPHVIMTEQSEEVLEQFNDGPSCRIHYRVVSPKAVGWDVLLDQADKVNTMSQKALSNLSAQHQKDFRQYEQVILNCQDFKCSRCSKSLGAVDSWDHTAALGVDSLSGLGDLAMSHCVADKPQPTEADYGRTQGMMMNLIQMILSCDCWFVLTAHPVRLQNALTGGFVIQASTPGKALTPKLPQHFSDIIWTRREGKEFFWSTTEGDVALKARNVAWDNKLPPSWAPVYRQWAATHNLEKAA